MWKDIQYGFRMLTKNPGFTAVAALSLALGIGVNSTIFSFVNAVLLRPMPVERPGELVEVYSSMEQFPYSVNSYQDFIDIRDTNDVFSEMAAHAMISATYTQDGNTELILGETATWNYFQTLGVKPALGRAFLPEEDETEGTHPVALVSHGFWERRTGKDPSLIGKPIRINGKPHTVVGIAPPTFTGTIPGLSPEFWIPTMMSDNVELQGITDSRPSPTGDTRIEQRGTRWLFVKGRLKPGATLEQAQAQLATIMKRLEQEHPETNDKRGIRLLSASKVRLHPMIDSALSPAALLLLAVVGMVLLIACANVANMLLARASARRREIAVRLAIGASRTRLVRQLLTESVLLAGLGGALGLLLAYWTSGLILAFRPPGPIQITLDLGIDSRVLLFTVLVSFIAALAFGLAPALRASRPNLVPSLKNESQVETGDRRFGLRNLLVTGQVAVSVILLVGAALLVRSLQNARQVDPGFQPDRLAVMSIDLDLLDYSEEAGKTFYERLKERMNALPGVESAGLTSSLPLTMDINATGIFIDGHQQTPDDPAFIVDRTAVTPGYLKMMKIPLVQGRDFKKSDTEDSPPVAIVSEAFAQLYFPGENAVGKRFHTRALDGPTTEIIGVCRDYKVRTLGEEPRPYIHFARAQRYGNFAYVVVRTEGDPAAMVENLRREMLALEPQLIFLEADTLNSLAAVTLLPVRMGAVLIGIFGVLGMLLAAIGLYGVISYSVSRRTHEIGMRLALGAKTEDVLKLVLRQGMFVALLGVALGIAGAAALSRVLSTVLFVSPTDPVSFTVASVLLLGVAAIANLIPARRATRVDPVIALRYE